MNKAIIIGRLNKSGEQFNDIFEKEGEIMDQISNLVPHSWDIATATVCF